MKLLLLRRGRSALAAIVTALVVGLGLVAVPFLTSPASAVSGTTGPINVTITPTTGLVSGQTISIDATATSGTMSDILVHVCDPGIVPVNQFKFTSDVYCPNVTLTGGDTNNIVDKTLANTTTGHVDFKVGTGHAHWIDGFNPSPPANTHDLDCDSTHSCLLVMQFSSNIAPGTFYYSTPLTYAGQPGAPTLNTATAGDSQISTAWTPAADTGNGTIDQYTVTVTRTSGPADGGSPHVYTVAAPTTTKVATGLVNFATYDVKVTTRTVAADGTTHFTSVDSNVLSATPGPAGPTSVSGTPADHAVNLTWSPPSFVTGLTSYRITVYTEPGHSQVNQVDTGSTSTAFQVTSLTNGTQYTFTVAAQYGAGNFSAPSAASPVIVPNGKFITQTIDVTRPQGDLVLTQACATADPYPVDVNGVPNPTYPTNCSVHLGIATLVKTGPNAGNYFQASGAIQQVTVVDTRDTDPGWTASAAVSNFSTGGASPKTFSGNDLGFTPVVTDHSLPFTSPDGPYTQDVAPGGAVAPGAPGLLAAQTLAKGGAAIGTPAANHGGLGIAHLDASLNLLIPVFAKSGLYTAVMTITAV